MAYREVTRVDTQEIIRRWQAGEGYRRIASGTGLSRNTVRKYLTAAKAEGIARDGPVPTGDQLCRLAVIGQPGPRQAETPSEDLLAPWADQVYQWLTGDRLQLTRIHELLLGRGCPVSYQSLRRFIQRRNWSRRSRITVRMEDTPPGEVAEVDFGRLGPDPRSGHRPPPYAVWALIVVLAYSTALLCLADLRPDAGGRHRRAGVGLDILRRRPSLPGHRQFPAGGGGSGRTASRIHPGIPGILPAPRLYSRRGQSQASQGQTQGGAGRPVRPRAPLQGRRVSRACHTSGQRRSAGAAMSRGSAFTAPPAGNQWWSSRTRSAESLVPWDGEPYEIADWRDAKVHPDHHVQCRQALYSVPSALCPPGQRVEIRVDSKLVHIYHPSTGSGRQADQDPRPSAQGWPRHRSRGLSGPPLRLHHQGARPYQAPRDRVGPSGG